MSLLVRSEILLLPMPSILAIIRGIYGNKFKMHLYQKAKAFCQYFIAFLEST